MTIKLLLVDDHAMFREALRVMLSSDPLMEVVGELSDGSRVVEACAELQPQVVVMDVNMPNVNGVEAMRRLKASLPQIRVVALTGFSYKQFVMEMLDAGATAYVIKSAAASQLHQAIVSAAAGKIYLCPETSELLIRSNLRNSSITGNDAQNRRLGRRETAVLRLLATGKTSPEIGEELHIASSTVDVHRRNIMNKLELHNVAELTRYAIRIGLIDL